MQKALYSSVILILLAGAGCVSPTKGQRFVTGQAYELPCQPDHRAVVNLADNGAIRFTYMANDGSQVVEITCEGAKTTLIQRMATPDDWKQHVMFCDGTNFAQTTVIQTEDMTVQYQDRDGDGVVDKKGVNAGDVDTTWSKARVEFEPVRPTR